MSVHRSARSLQTGLSLIELMVSMLLGLIVIAAVFNIYLANSRSARYTEGLHTLQENGRYGMSILQRGVRLAGYSSSFVAGNNLQAFDIANSSSSRIAVRFQSAYDCNGLATTATDGIAVDTYAYNATTGQVTCQGNQVGSSAMPVIEGVDGFRILYGIDSDNDSDSEEPQSYIAYNASINSEEVVALRFALLINSGRPVRSRILSREYVLLDQVVGSFDDRIARDVFTSTVKIRNPQT